MPPVSDGATPSGSIEALAFHAAALPLVQEGGQADTSRSVPLTKWEHAVRTGNESFAGGPE